jgi:hypothetical protein
MHQETKEIALGSATPGGWVVVRRIKPTSELPYLRVHQPHRPLYCFSSSQQCTQAGSSQRENRKGARITARHTPAGWHRAVINKAHICRLFLPPSVDVQETQMSQITSTLPVISININQICLQ